MTDSGQLHHEVRGGIAWVTLARPEKKNALSRVMWGAIAPMLEQLIARGDVAVVALRGAGGTFGAGADLRDVLSATAGREQATRYCTLVVSALLAVATCPLPTVALIEGVAAGGAAELALATDRRLAAPSATISFPFARLGVVPDRFTLRRLVALIGTAAARRLALTGAPVTGAEGLALGLVDEVAEPAALDARVTAWASELASGSPRAIARIKGVLFDAEQPAHANDPSVDALIGPMVDSFVSGDVRAAALAFLGKSPLDPAP